MNDYRYVLGTDAAGAKSNGRPKIDVLDAGPLVATLRITSDAPGCERLVREVRVVDGLDRVELANHVDRKAGAREGRRPLRVRFQRARRHGAHGNALGRGPAERRPDARRVPQLVHGAALGRRVQRRLRRHLGAVRRAAGGNRRDDGQPARPGAAGPVAGQGPRNRRRSTPGPRTTTGTRTTRPTSRA